MKLAITGGAGFLGYHLCNCLCNKFDEIFIVDIAPIDPREYPQNIKYFNVDVRNKKSLAQIFKNVDIIIHAASALPLWKRKDILDININGTRAVLEAALNSNIEKLIYISSTAVYGIPKTHPLYEDSPLKGVGPYGESKIEAEKICQEYVKKGMCILIVRPKSFIGTGRLGVFQILYDWIENGKKIPIIGNGRNRYQLLEVQDLVEAIYLLINAPAIKVNPVRELRPLTGRCADGGIKSPSASRYTPPTLSVAFSNGVNNVFNIGAEEFGTVMEDVSALCDYAGTGARVMPTPAKVTKILLAIFEKLKLSPLYKWIYATADKDSFVSNGKIQATLGWLPKYSNKDALIRSYSWYLA
ncbi:MAG: NAD(P)-dependent oxidoreductase, partial [Candidatus Omnitrophota bacterium]|nr:NAD(P)-dependent oxidoreductase [Candidatus Omnitrophota bacterium]